MAGKRDLYLECNTNRAPEDLFTVECCSRCFNAECTRSFAGKEKFDQRVTTWEDRLFLNVPRMAKDDPRYPTLTAKGFLTLDVGRTPEVNTWSDPRDLTREPEPPKLYMPPGPSPASPPPRRPLPTPLASEPLPEPEPLAKPAVPAAAAPPRRMDMLNTPSQSGKILSGPQVPKAPPPKDPWAGPSTPAASKDRVVQRGAKIKLGGE